MSAALDLDVFDVNLNRNTTFKEIKGDRALVVDFWHTKCVRCPAALEKINGEASTDSHSAIFVGCALSQGEGNLDVVRDVVR